MQSRTAYSLFIFVANVGLIQTFIRCSKTVTIAYTRKDKKATKKLHTNLPGVHNTTYTLLETIQCKREKMLLLNFKN